MAALGWLLNLGFAGSATTQTVSQPTADTILRRQATTETPLRRPDQPTQEVLRRHST